MIYMSKIGVIGDKDSILGFKALGFSVFPAVSKEDAEQKLNDLAKQDYAVIYIVEQTAQLVADSIAQYKEQRFPAIIPIPGNQGSLGIGMQSVKASVEKAVGADILFREE